MAAAATSTDGTGAASSDSLKKWESENDVQVMQPDEIYKYDAASYEEFLRSKPWTKEYACLYT